MSIIEAYTTKTGKKLYRVRYRKPDRKQTDKRGFTTIRDAKAFLATVEVDKLTGSYLPPSAGKTTVEELAEHWQASLVDSAESWKARQESIWQVHVKPKWAHWRVNDVKTSDIQAWVNDLAANDRKPAPLAPKTIRHISGVLAGILDVAVKDRSIITNPARGNLRLPRVKDKEKNFLTKEQVKALVSEVPERYKTVVWFLVTSGARWGEMAALRPKDLLGNGRVRLARSYARVNNSFVVTDNKGHEARTVAVPPQVEAMLQQQARDKGWDDLLWEAPRRGGALRPPKTGHWLSEACKRCREQDSTFPARFSAHELRHTAASLMISAGAHVKTIQRQLGHKDASMTLNQYGHLFEDDLDVISVAMGSALF